MATNSFSQWIKNHREILLLSVILVIAVFLRWYNLGTESIVLDEAASIKESAMTIQGMAAHSNQPPLYFLLLRGWMAVFGTTEVALRSLSAVFGVLAVGVVFMVGKLLINRRVGLAAAFLVAIAYFPIKYAQTARGYSLLLLLSVLSYWCFIGILKRNSTRWYIGYLLTTLLMAYTHFYGLFIIASQFIFFLIFFKRYPAQRWKFLGSVAIIIIGLIPFVLLLKNNISSIAGQGFWIPEPGPKELINTLLIFTGSGPGISVLFFIFVLLVIWSLFSVVKTGKKQSNWRVKNNADRRKWKIQFDSPEVVVLLVLWFVIPILVPFIESRLMTPIYQDKYAIGTLPALCLLVATGLSKLKWQWIFYPVLAAIVAFSSWGLADYYKYVTNEQWRETAQLVESKAEPGDVIVFCESYYEGAFDYYYKGQLEETGFNSLSEAQQFVSTKGRTIAHEKGRVWIIMAYNKASIADYLIKTYDKSRLVVGTQYYAITIMLFDFKK
jgi:mannosyltransferase